MDRDAVWTWVHAERAALADLLSSLTPAEWEHPSLCEGWTVRDVAAHVISSPQATLGSVAVAFVRARGNFDRCMHDEARRSSARPVPEILADYRRFASSRRRPPGTRLADPLLDVLVHTQDIALPLGREHAMPVDAAAVAADRVWHAAFPFHARARLRGFRLAATDTAWAAGDGALVEGPVEALLLLLTGRTVALPRLTGDGLPRLAERIAAPR